MDTKAIRMHLVKLMDGTVENERKWHYLLARPLNQHTTEWEALHGVVWSDCSNGYQLLCRLAGAPNPMGLPWGYGNTSSAYQTLTHISKDQAQVGDAIIYGPGGSHHIAVVRVPGADPLLWSNGREGAPELVRFSTERQWQPEPETWVRLMPPDPKAPELPPEPLYWAWLRWSLGEGEFKGHGGDPKRRPKGLPKVIPPQWWLRKRRFLAARKAAQAG